ncbi:MAG: hypothetical protein AAB573_04695 [Patescibacteria group bacterium]
MPKREKGPQLERMRLKPKWTIDGNGQVIKIGDTVTHHIKFRKGKDRLITSVKGWKIDYIFAYSIVGEDRVYLTRVEISHLGYAKKIVGSDTVVLERPS